MALNIENILASGDRNAAGKILANLMAKIFQDQAFEHEAKKAARILEKGQQHETKTQREREEVVQAAKEKARAYHQVRSQEVDKQRAELSRQQRAVEIRQRLINRLQNQADRPPGSDYLFSAIEADVDVQQAVAELISESSAAAEAIDAFIDRGNELHGDARDLIKKAQTISYEADKFDLHTDIQPVLEAIGNRVQQLVIEEFHTIRGVSRPGHKAPEYLAQYLLEDPGIVLTNEEKRVLGRREYEGDRLSWHKTNDTWRQKVSELVTRPRTRPAQKRQEASRIEAQGVAASDVIDKKLVSSIDAIWGEFERKVATDDVSAEELEQAYRAIRREESKTFPRDVPPGSEAYNRAVQEIRDYTEGKLQLLQDRLQKRLRTETPQVKTGIKSVDEFLMEMGKRKGRLGDLFRYNPEMEKLFLGIDDRSRRFRDRLFLEIHSSVLTDQRNSASENFGLYERADFTSFIDILRIGLGDLTVRETGQSLGQAWSDYYNNLSNAIRRSRDLDFWATQPGANIENFNKSLGMFQNEYIAQAVSIPAVNAAFRAYEMTLRSIQSSNDGYIPPGLVEYSAPGKGSYWDLWSEDALKQMVSLGSVPDVLRDEDTKFHVVGSDGHTVQIDQSKPLKLSEMSDAEIKMYMTLAKGMGLVSARFLEIFANTRVPGSTQPERALDQFHSMPYEGVAKSLNYFSQYVHKWRMGSYKFFYLFNQLIPDKKNWINDSREAAKAYMLYQQKDGSFERVYGEKAKRFFDLYNFSGISSAIGKDTLWRQWDSTVGWSDRMREFLGGPTQLALSGRYAEDAVKSLLVISNYREKYRQEVIRRNRANPSLNLPTSGAGFDKLWEDYGKHQFSAQIEREWDELNGKHPLKGMRHTKKAKYTHHLVEAYQKALKARIWVEMAMRNPLVAAHSLKVPMPLIGAKGEKPISLHQLLVQDILGIPPEDTKYGALYGKTGFATTPTKRQQQYMKEVLRLEADLAAVREIAINEGRDLTEADFQRVIRNDLRRSQALEYWRKVRMSLMGTDQLTVDTSGGRIKVLEAEDLYSKFGLGLTSNEQDYAWDYKKIHHLDHKLHDIAHHASHITLSSQEGGQISVSFLLPEAIGSDPEWIYGTDDIAFRRMDWLNLGNRHWLRRGGDIAAHEAGGNAVVEYLTKGLSANPDKHKLPELLQKVVDGYSGDMIEIGWSVAGALAYMTDRLYTWDWRRLGSTAQLDVWGTRKNVAAWTANGRREFWDALEHMDVLPPHAHFYHYDHIGGVKFKPDIHHLRDVCNAGNVDVWIEIILLGTAIAFAITVYRALTAKSEEEEGGGGGGHH